MRIFPTSPPAHNATSPTAQPGERQTEQASDGFGLLMPLNGPTASGQAVRILPGAGPVNGFRSDPVTAAQGRLPGPAELPTVGTPLTAQGNGEAGVRAFGLQTPTGERQASPTGLAALRGNETPLSATAALVQGKVDGQPATGLPTGDLPQSGRTELTRLGNTDLLATLRPALNPELATSLTSEGKGSDATSSVAALAQSGASPANASTAAARGLPQWGPLTLPADAQHWAREMLTPLRDQLRFQFEQQIKSAELRLDPPDLGRIELNVRLEGERLIVQLNAANPTVREALQSGAERLRDELGQSHGGHVDVDVGSEGDGRQPDSREPAIGRAGLVTAGVAPKPTEDQFTHQIDALA